MQAALQYPGQIATLIVPADAAWLEAGRSAPVLPKPTPAMASAEAIEQAAGALRSSRKGMILICGAALIERGLNAAGRVAAVSRERCSTPMHEARYRTIRRNPLSLHTVRRYAPISGEHLL